MCATDEELLETIEHALSRYPSLRQLVPAAFPRAGKYEVNIDRIASYANTRQERYPHLLNLPLALHEAVHAENDDIAELMQFLLATLDEFASRFRSHMSAKGLLAPLWEATWKTSEPEIWSIAACALMANNLVKNGKNVVGFEVPIGDPTEVRLPNSDIAVRIGNALMHVEVQLWHSATFEGRSNDDVRADLERRATQKASKKLAALPADDAAIIVDVVFVMMNDIGRALSGLGAPIAFPDRPGAHWIPLRLVAVRDEALRFDLHNFDAE